MIELTEGEQQLFEVLLSSVKNKQKETVLRVAGGWVRDKILKQQSVDIDIAMDDQSGIEFAASVNEYLLSIGKETRTIAVIQANPDQSKHLETANVRVMGYEIDCVNLRAETYTDSRIPEIRNGTALEDALRRDFTINALFYNLNTSEVEDLSGRGLADLALGVIRTPISAHITFRDDPLRVLRAIRFASRLNFSLDPELVDAGSSADIRAALMDKVSRERVYKECEGCMSKENSRPYMAFHLMHRLQLLDVVLPLASVLRSYPLIPESAATVPDTAAFTAHWVDCSLLHMYWLNVLLTGRAHGLLWPATTSAVVGTPMTLTAADLAEPKHGVQVKVLHWAAATSALSSLHVTEKGKTAPLVPILLREGLKMDNATMKSVQVMLDCVGQFRELSSGQPVSVETAGLLLRVCKEQWRDCLLLACALELSGATSAPSCTASHIATRGDSPGASASQSGVKRHLAEVFDETAVFTAAERPVSVVFQDITMRAEDLATINRFAALESVIDGMGLDHVWQMKPLMNGSELISLLGLPKGPMVGKLVELQTLWQIRNLGCTDKVACLEFLRSTLANANAL